MGVDELRVAVQGNDAANLALPSSLAAVKLFCVSNLLFLFDKKLHSMQNDTEEEVVNVRSTGSFVCTISDRT